MSNKRKVIGIPGYRNHDDTSFGIGITYAEYLSKFGNIRIIFPWEDLVKVDCLVLPGGADLSPGSYKAIPGFRTGDTDVHKQHFYDHKLRFYVESRTPIIGICLGHQQLGVFFQSKITQDLPYHDQSPERRTEGHKVFLLDSEGNKILKGKSRKSGKEIYEEISVNSHHHQGILRDDLGRDLIPLGVSEEWDGSEVVEIFRHKTLPIVGCQSHPEEYPIFEVDNLFREILEPKEQLVV